jgi:hypothetical protein
MDLRASIREILSDKKARSSGLHVKFIARHIYNRTRTLFSDADEPGIDELKIKINRLLLYDIRRKKSEFVRVINPKTNTYRKGVYRLRNRVKTEG